MISSPMLSKKAILVRDLSKTNLNAFYEGLPYRYNSIIDLVSQGEQIKRDFLERTQLTDQLFYQIFTLSLPIFRLPILECLEIDGISGGMLSSYLHDIDREMLEGEGEVRVDSGTMLVWQALIKDTEFSFVFRSSRSCFSRTSSYMRQIGFKERRFCPMRCFFNGIDNGNRFVGVMQELISAMEGTNNFYSFKHTEFRAAKIRQSRIAQHYFQGMII